MMKKFRKGLIVVVSLFMILTLSMELGANEFQTNRKYYENLCFTKVTTANAAVCRDFQKYINDEAKRVNQNLSTIRGDITNIRNNITKYAQEIVQYQAQIEELERQIEVLSRSIISMEKDIEILVAEIKALEETIRIRDETIQERMVAMQGFLTTNGFVEIIMGSSDFTDLVRRLEGIQDITYYDNQQIILMQQEKAKVEEDKIELERQRNVLEDNRQNYVLTQESVGALIETREEIISEFRRQESQLIVQERQVINNLNSVRNQLKQLETALANIAGSSGFIRPIRTGAFISAGAWAYPNGGRHLAVDFAAPVGTPIVAVANGVVVYRADRCPTWGFLGNTCGYPGATGGGNQVYLMVSVNGRSYGILYAHLQSGSTANIGRVVKAGDVIARNGSSGNSSGPHLHIEVIYLGTNSVNYYAQNWNGSLSFGAGWYQTGYNNRCEANGNRPPCRLNPLQVFNVRVGQRY